MSPNRKKCVIATRALTPPRDSDKPVLGPDPEFSFRLCLDACPSQAIFGVFKKGDKLLEPKKK